MMEQPVLQRLECPNCTAPLEQHSATAQTIVCSRCGTHIAIGMGEPENLGQGRKAPRAPKPIQIGDRATLNGEDFIVLGRVVYRGWDERDRDESWVWHEWLMGGANGKLLWLAYDEQGFALFRKARFRGQFNPQSDHFLHLGEGKRIPILERYPARIIGAEGELTWKAKPGEALWMAEGQKNNVRYSIQQTDEELEIHEGTPFEETALAQAFGNQEWAQQVKRQKNNRELTRTAGVIGLLFAAAAFVVALLVSGSGQELEPRFLTVSRSQPVVTTPVDFNITGRPAIIGMRLDGNILPENTFVDVDMAIISPDGERSFLFVQELWHETGRDEDGFWRDTRYATSEMFVPLQTGQHTLELTYDPTNPVEQVRVAVTIRRNHVMPIWFIVYGVVVALAGGFLLFSGMRNPHSA